MVHCAFLPVGSLLIPITDANEGSVVITELLRLRFILAIAFGFAHPDCIYSPATTLRVPGALANRTSISGSRNARPCCGVLSSL